MATYLFTCPSCGLSGQVIADIGSTVHAPTCVCDGAMRRDYYREAVGLTGLGLMKAEREAGSKEAYDRLFLPHNDDFKGEGDPDGVVGMRQWREDHQPRPTNKNPRWPGHVEKQVL